MIKKPADLKLAFRNGALPDQGDFGDLIDSFLPRDAVSDTDLAALREMAAWWRARGQGGALPPLPPLPPVPVPVPSPPVPPPVVPPSTPGGATPAPPAPGGDAVPAPAPTIVVVPADGNWAMLPLTAGQDGTWACSAITLSPGPSYRVTGNAIAFVKGAQRHLVQNIVPESNLPWRTLQFAWRKEEGSDQYRLALRSRRAFGPDTTGSDTKIRCTIALQASYA